MATRQPLPTTLLVALVGLGLAVGGTTARAEVGGPLMPSNGAPVGHVVRASLGAMPYQNGGIGDEEVADMDGHASGYNVRLTFSEGNDNSYAANLKLRVTSMTGATVFSLDDAGPLTDIALPPGRYKVSAWYGDAVRTGTLSVGRGGHATLNLHWNHEHPTDIAP